MCDQLHAPAVLTPDNSSLDKREDQQHKLLSPILLSRLTLYTGKLSGIISVDFDATGQLLITYSAFVRHLRKNGNTMKQCISCL